MEKRGNVGILAFCKATKAAILAFFVFYSTLGPYHARSASDMLVMHCGTTVRTP